MRLLTDHDVYAVTINFLRSSGHDVVPAFHLKLAQAEDVEILRAAHEQDRVLVTRDRDFGALVFVEDNGPGVIYLRILPSNQNAVHDELARVLKQYDEHELQVSFVVIEPGRHRIRRRN